jgi:hypothetical protein
MAGTAAVVEFETAVELRYHVAFSASSAKPGNRTPLIRPSLSSSGNKGNSSKMTCKTVTSLFPTTASDVGPFVWASTGHVATTTPDTTAIDKADIHRDQTRIAFDRSKAIGPAILNAIPRKIEKPFPSGRNHLATPKPSNKDKPAINKRRTDSFTFGPSNKERRSIKAQQSAGTNATTPINTDASNEDILAAENMVMFFE